MTLGDVKKDIQSKELKHFYIFAGDEIEVINTYINEIAKVSGMEVRRPDNLADIWTSLTNNSIFSGANYCYVVRDDKSIMDNEKLWGQLGTFDSIIILLITKLDKRGKFYKHFKDNIVVVEHLSNEVLYNYVKRQIDLNDKHIKYLIDICEQDYSKILLEADKIRCLSATQNFTVDTAFENLLADGVIYEPPRDAIFDFVNAYMNRDVLASFGLLDECLEYGESALPLLTVMYNNVKRVLQVQSCKSNDISANTGIPKNQVWAIQKQCGNYSIGELVAMLRLIRDTERGIKLGLIEESISVQYVLVNTL